MPTVGWRGWAKFKESAPRAELGLLVAWHMACSAWPWPLLLLPAQTFIFGGQRPLRYGLVGK